MDNLSTIFDQAKNLVIFSSGLVYFVMGLAIALQSRQSSRLNFARSLMWLASFGITLGFYEWFELLSPVSDNKLTSSHYLIIHVIHLILLSISFSCLLEFGVALLRPLQRGQWIHPVTIGMVVSYGVLIILFLPQHTHDLQEWHNSADTLARYFLCFPGGLLAAYSLREQTNAFITPLQAPNIEKNFKLASISLASYALLAGLTPPPVSFFPGNLLNSDTFKQIIGVPAPVFQAIIGAALAITIIRALEVFQIETDRHIEQMEQWQIMSAERERLARELHDRTIQTAYTAGLLVDSARKLAPPGSQISTRLDNAIMALDEVIADLRYQLGELSPSNNGETLREVLQNVAENPHFRSLVNIRLEQELSGGEEFSNMRMDHITTVLMESMANIIRHARATEVIIHVSNENNDLVITIRDNGIGISDDHEIGYGIRNMQERANLMAAKLTIQSIRGKGTEVRLKIPRNNNR